MSYLGRLTMLRKTMRASREKLSSQTRFRSPSDDGKEQGTRHGSFAAEERDPRKSLCGSLAPLQPMDRRSPMGKLVERERERERGERLSSLPHLSALALVIYAARYTAIIVDL